MDLVALRLFCFQLLSTVDGQCAVSKSKDSLCLSDVTALNKMQRELMEKKVDITLYLAFGFKQLSGENTTSPSEPGKWRDNPTDYAGIKTLDFFLRQTQELYGSRTIVTACNGTLRGIVLQTFRAIISCNNYITVNNVT